MQSDSFEYSRGELLAPVLPVNGDRFMSCGRRLKCAPTVEQLDEYTWLWTAEFEPGQDD